MLADLRRERGHDLMNVEAPREHVAPPAVAVHIQAWVPRSILEVTNCILMGPTATGCPSAVRNCRYHQCPWPLNETVTSAGEPYA